MGSGGGEVGLAIVKETCGRDSLKKKEEPHLNQKLSSGKAGKKKEKKEKNQTGLKVRRKKFLHLPILSGI